MLKHYVKYLLPGAFMPEETTREVRDRCYRKAFEKMPDNCYCFYFYDVEEVVQDGEPLRGQHKNYSGRYYPGATIDGENLHCRMGNMQPRQKGDVIF